jgi:hypothetical protein
MWELASGSYLLHVRAQGRSGEGEFTQVEQPVIPSASPASGPPGTILGLTVAGLGTKDAGSATYAVLQLPGGLRPAMQQLGSSPGRSSRSPARSVRSSLSCTRLP